MLGHFALPKHLHCQIPRALCTLAIQCTGNAMHFALSEHLHCPSTRALCIAQALRHFALPERLGSCTGAVAQVLGQLLRQCKVPKQLSNAKCLSTLWQCNALFIARVLGHFPLPEHLHCLSTWALSIARALGHFTLPECSRTFKNQILP